jgi:hypothetical protein
MKNVFLQLRPVRFSMKLTYLLLSFFLIACSTSSTTPAASLSAEGAAAPLVDAGAQTAAVPPRTALDAPEQPIPPPPKVDTRTAVQKAADAKREALAACRGSDGKWYCPKIAAPLMASTSPNAATCGPACTVGNWYIDPQNTSTCASDGNSCTSATCSGSGIGPCVTFSQIVTRLGSTQPVYPAGQNVVFNWLSAQVAYADAGASTDDVFFAPQGSAGSLFEASCQLGWTTIATTTLGVISGGVGFVDAGIAAGQTPLTWAAATTAVPALAVGQLVLNSARTSYASVAKITAGSATLTQPQTVASLSTVVLDPVGVADNDWATGDPLTIYSLPQINLKRWSPYGGDVVATSGVSGWVFGCTIADPGAGASAYFAANQSTNSVYSCDYVLPRFHSSSVGGRSDQVFVMNTVFSTAGVSDGGGAMLFYGGAGVSGWTFQGGESQMFNNPLMLGSVSLLAGGYLTGGVYSSAQWTGNGLSYYQLGNYFWGTGGIAADFGAMVQVTGSNTFTSSYLSSGTMNLDSTTTGCGFDGGVTPATYTCGITVNPANIDSSRGLIRPGTGSRFSLAN